MKFIVDAQLPYELKTFLISLEHDAIHTDDLPLKAGTPDSAINEISKTQERIVITKDTDFLDSYYINNSPTRLLLITTGNIVNKELLDYSPGILPQSLKLLMTTLLLSLIITI
jgi:predicted nuclease of predicted toxin-antitoxin system